MASNQCLYMVFCVLLCLGLCTCHRDLMNNSNDHVSKPMEADDHIGKPTVTKEVTSWQYKDMPKVGALDDVVENFGCVGCGTGMGYGVGTGYGQGSGFGSGSGNFGGPGGYGEGEGFGSGSRSGGSGYGEGRGYGSDSGQGCIPGYNCPVTSTPCPHCGYPVALSPPGQGCGQWEEDSMGQKAMHVSHEPNMEMNSANDNRYHEK